MNQLYRAIGISKQAIHQYATRQAVFDQKVEQLVLEADGIRQEHPGCGVEKMYRTLKPGFIGRDRFVDLLMSLGYRLRRAKNYKRTTRASKLYYPNLIKGFELTSPLTVWQSDITFIEVGNRFYYGVFILDVYTRKIVGYQVSDHMRATANVKALLIALKDHPPPRIHHSDRGGQYIYEEYVDLLKSNRCDISMGLTAQDNAYAERFHRTLKEEYLHYWKPTNFYQLKRYVKRAVDHYNQKRTHENLNDVSPMDFEKDWSLLPINRRPSLSIFNDELLTKSGQH